MSLDHQERTTKIRESGVLTPDTSALASEIVATDRRFNSEFLRRKSQLDEGNLEEVLSFYDPLLDSWSSALEDFERDTNEARLGVALRRIDRALRAGADALKRDGRLPSQ